MRTARFEISKEILFELMGMRGLDAEIVCAADNVGRISIQLSGEDNRLPDREDFPQCNVVCTKIDSHFEVIS